MRKKPELVFLLRSTCQGPISFRKLMHLLQPVFADAGSN